MKKPELQVTLTVVEGPDAGLSVRLTKPQSIIGRDGADVVLQDRKVSHQHAVVEVAGADVTVVDLESRNGVVVNGKKISRIRLSNLDEVRLGTTKFKILIVEDLETFKSRNAPPFDRGPDRPRGPRQPKRDIASMIDDELKQFSKWDLGSEPKSVGEAAVAGQGFVLEVLEGPDAGKRIRLERETTTLGRGKADISFRDSDISRLHATIEILGKGQALIRDVGSTNGTYVNHKRVTEVKLCNGDRIALGATLCRWLVEE